MIKEELLLFVEIEDRAVMVFVDRDLRNGVDEKKEAGDPSLEWNKCVLFAETHVSISSFKAALGSKKKLRKNKAKQITILKGPESIPYPEEEGHNWIDYLQVKSHWRESQQMLFLMTSVLRTACSSAPSCVPGTDKE